ncbi:hypothetical protein [Cellulomonas sp. NPDC058312]|uniref:hypothetical protein n=1 Tax=Cellulomonas sp. NPDC058312 TaxID=3346441 RepID=UPI0036EEC590
MARSRSSARPVVIGAAVLAAVLSGCSVTNQITTEKPYAASDGVRATLGDLTAENLLLVAEAADGPAALQGAFTNRGDDALTVEVSTTGSTERVRVAAGETVLLGGQDGEDVVLETPDAPGATTEVTIATGAGGTQTVQVPVLDGTLPEYTDLVPTPEPEPEITTQATEEPAPTEATTAEPTTAP